MKQMYILMSIIQSCSDRKPEKNKWLKHDMLNFLPAVYVIVNNNWPLSYAHMDMRSFLSWLSRRPAQSERLRDTDPFHLFPCEVYGFSESKRNVFSETNSCNVHDQEVSQFQIHGTKRTIKRSKTYTAFAITKSKALTRAKWTKESYLFSERGDLTARWEWPNTSMKHQLELNVKTSSKTPQTQNEQRQNHRLRTVSSKIHRTSQ